MQLTLDAIKFILSDRSYLKKIYIEKIMILSTEEVQDVLERSNLTHFSSWPDFSVWPVEENTQSWRTLVAKYSSIKFGQAIMYMIEDA